MLTPSPILQRLAAAGLPPFGNFDVTFENRINLITGDNGLGKSLLLDLAFWQLTNTWPNSAPLRASAAGAYVESVVAGEAVNGVRRRANYDASGLRWVWERGRPPMTALVIYARSNGGFSVWDPARNYFRNSPDDEVAPAPRAFLMDQGQLWNGLTNDQDKSLSEGLIRDWVTWQREGREEFFLLQKVLEQLSPESDGPFKPGPSIALDPDDSRDFPTIDTPYGRIPLMHTSEAIRRIVGLAYLVVWTWVSHKRAALARNWDLPIQRLVVLVDEIEAHLHPKWQRKILPALLRVMNQLGGDAEVQLIAVTHAPLLLASMEPLFDREQDRFFTIDAERSASEQSAVIVERDFEVRGGADSWLKSDFFKLNSARSEQAEAAIKKAMAWLANPHSSPDSRESIDTELRTVLNDIDEFWVRWMYAAEILSDPVGPVGHIDDDSPTGASN